MRGSGTQLVLSAVSSWEVAIKWAVGRMALPEPPVTYVPRMMQISGVGGLAVGHSHALAVATLPRHHADPFDRLLIAQSQLEAIPIVTADPVFDAYDVEIVKP
jgi:PIN domain nuclease of toxin-antitoxin system